MGNNGPTGSVLIVVPLFNDICVNNSGATDCLGGRFPFASSAVLNTPLGVSESIIMR